LRGLQCLESREKVPIGKGEGTTGWSKWALLVALVSWT
jgi:hypothetical protein